MTRVSASRQDELSPVESPAILVLDIALRDRDFARLQTAQDVQHGGLGALMVAGMGRVV